MFMLHISFQAINENRSLVQGNFGWAFNWKQIHFISASYISPFSYKHVLFKAHFLLWCSAQEVSFLFLSSLSFQN